MWDDGLTEAGKAWRWRGQGQLSPLPPSPHRHVSRARKAGSSRGQTGMSSGLWLTTCHIWARADRGGKATLSVLRILVFDSEQQRQQRQRRPPPCRHLLRSTTHSTNAHKHPAWWVGTSPAGVPGSSFGCGYDGRLGTQVTSVWPPFRVPLEPLPAKFVLPSNHLPANTPVPRAAVPTPCPADLGASAGGRGLPQPWKMLSSTLGLCALSAGHDNRKHPQTRPTVPRGHNRP